MNSHSIRVCFGLVATVTLSSPAIAQSRAERQAISEMRILQEQTMRLQQLISTIDESLQALSSQLDEQANATVRAFADQRLQSEDVAGDVRILREKLDDTNVRISSMSQEIEALRVAIPPVPFLPPTLLTDPETGLPITPVGGAPRTAPMPTLAAGTSPQRMYNTAWADYTSGQWDLSIEGFQAYLEIFPRSELADDAQFYLGENHYAAGRIDESIKAFETVLMNYPDGDVVPEAHYKRGLALDFLGETDSARMAFELLVDNYPDSDMATLAEQALDRLNQLER